MMVSELGTALPSLAGERKTYRSVLSAAGSSARRGASRWLEAAAGRGERAAAQRTAPAHRISLFIGSSLDRSMVWSGRELEELARRLARAGHGPAERVDGDPDAGLGGAGERARLAGGHAEAELAELALGRQAVEDALAVFWADRAEDRAAVADAR